MRNDNTRKIVSRGWQTFEEKQRESRAHAQEEQNSLLVVQRELGFEYLCENVKTSFLFSNYFQICWIFWILIVSYDKNLKKFMQPTKFDP